MGKRPKKVEGFGGPPAVKSLRERVRGRRAGPSIKKMRQGLEQPQVAGDREAGGAELEGSGRPAEEGTE
jgi:hypothetical protein